jgi:hypothetical protein
MKNIDEKKKINWLMNNINTGIDLSQEVARTYVIEKNSTDCFTYEVVTTGCSTTVTSECRQNEKLISKSMNESTMENELSQEVPLDYLFEHLIW